MPGALDFSTETMAMPRASCRAEPKVLALYAFELEALCWRLETRALAEGGL